MIPDGDWPIALARWVFFAAATVSFGTALFPFYAARRGERADMGWPGLVAAAAGLALVSALAWLALSVVQFGGEDFSSFVATAQTVLFETGFGPVWLVRIAAALLLLVAVAVWPNRTVLLTLAAIVLGSEARIGHSATGDALHRLSQVVHLLAAGAWLGGLPPLARALSRGARALGEADAARRMLLRFSAMGMIAVTLIALTGVVSAWFVDGGVFDFGDYERALAVKVALFLAMVAVAIFNRFSLLPRLQASGGALVLRRFGQSVAVEQALGLAVLFAASVLGMTAPPGG